MTTSSIRQILYVKEYENQHGKTFYHNLLMENGDKINIGKKNHLEIGAELIYEVDINDDKEYRKAKSVHPDFQNTPRPNNTKPAGNSKSFALSYAKDLVTKYAEVGLLTDPEKAAEVAVHIAKEIFQPYLDA